MKKKSTIALLLASVLMTACSSSADESTGQRTHYDNDNNIVVEQIKRGEVLTAKTFPLTADPVHSADAVPPLKEALESSSAGGGDNSDDAIDIPALPDDVDSLALSDSDNETAGGGDTDASFRDKLMGGTVNMLESTKVSAGNALHFLKCKYSDIVSEIADPSCHPGGGDEVEGTPAKI